MCIAIISFSVFFSACGMKTGLILDPPERYDIGTSQDSIEFRHQEQINDISFRGYHIFYKIVDANATTINISSETGISELLNDFKTNISSSESRVAQMINTDTFLIFNNYGYLCTIVKNDNYQQFDIDSGTTDEELLRNYPQILLNQINNNGVDYSFTIKSSTNITLNASTRLYYSNQNTDTNTYVTYERELFRHFKDTSNTIVHESFSSEELTNDDRGLPSTINFDSTTESYSIIIVFFGFAYGSDSNIIDTVFSEPEYLGAIVLNKS